MGVVRFDESELQLQACKEWRLLHECCNRGTFIRTGQHLLIARVKNTEGFS